MATSTGSSGLERRDSPAQTFGFRESPLATAINRSFATPGRPSTTTGGNSTSQGVVGPTVGGMAASMPKFIEEFLAKDLKQNQDKALWEGLVAARGGKSVEEIEKEQPWYSKIFGPSHFVMGAQYYTAQRNLAEWELETLKSMNELRKVDPSQVGQVLNESAQQFMTGSPATNAMIQATMIQKAGPLVDMHLKQRYEYLQRQAMQAQYDSFDRNSQVFEEYAKQYSRLSDTERADPKSSLGYAEARKNLVEQMAMPPGQDPKASEQQLESMILGAAQQGRFHTVNMIRDTGLLSLLPADKQKSIEDAVERYEQRHLRKHAALELAPDLIAWAANSATGQVSALESLTEAQRINKMAEGQTGISYPVITVPEIMSQSTSAATQYLRATERAADKLYEKQQKAADAEAKAAAEAETMTMLVSMVAQGKGGEASVLPGITTDKVDQALRAAYFAEGANDATKNQILIANAHDGFISPSIRDSLQNRVRMARGETYTESFGKSYEVWKQLNDTPGGGGGAAAAYFEDEHIRMLAFDSALKAGISREEAFKRTFGDEFLFGSERLDADDRKAAYEEIDDVVSDLDDFWWWGTDVGASGKGVIRNALVNNYVRIRKNSPELGPEVAAQQALTVAKANGLEIHGQWAWQNISNTQPMYRLAGVAEPDFGSLLEVTLIEKAKKAGAPTTFTGRIGEDLNYSIIRLPDENGQGIMSVHLYDDDGTSYPLYISSQELKDRRDSEAFKQRQKIKQTKRALPGEKPVVTFQDVHERRLRRIEAGADPATSGLW
ncbi:internal virion protein [Aquamicrobium phage P14]|uniref:Putative internal virion protein n=1 Tax=Aquamicrobium phage P14 TaxID=1927013 RepID=A0A1L5C073_9CAUD|nr:internal virion protein [Aquamicrobium phage P14]APL99499.1 putative internal virion protein [Aquamicrobium phage P14]